MDRPFVRRACQRHGRTGGLGAAGRGQYDLANRKPYQLLQPTNTKPLAGIDPGPGVDTNEETFEGSEDARDESNWSNTLAETKRIELELREAIASLSEADLEAPFGSSTETIGRELSRWMLHDAYHAGQIVLIRRQQGCWRS